jgi:hypothetical protein
MAFDAQFGVADRAFDGGDAHLSFDSVAGMAFEAGVVDIAFVVAAIGFDGGDARGVADTGPGDGTLGVAADAFAKDAGNSG